MSKERRRLTSSFPMALSGQAVRLSMGGEDDDDDDGD